MGNEHRIDMDNLNTKHPEMDNDFTKKLPGLYIDRLE